MGVCSVIGCKSRSLHPTSEGKHFFRFPKDLKNSKIRELWKKFCVKFSNNSNFKLKESSTICELHFSSESFIMKKKGRLYLEKNSVPTIYLKEFKNKVEKIEIPYDPEIQEYIDTENFNFTHDSFEREKQMLKERDEKVLEVKNLCRFCLENDKNIKCVFINKLKNFLKDSVDFLKLIDVEPPSSELLSEIVCEKCFQTLVDFDAFRKRCQKAQSDFVQEIQEMDENIQEIRGKQKEQTIWYKQEMIDEATMEYVVEEEVDQSFLIEEHVDDEVYDENSYEQNYSGYSIEEGKNNLSDDEMIEEDMEEEDYFIAEKSNMKIEQDDFFDSKDIYEGVDKDVVIKNPDRNIFAYRIYECFFCKLKFAGRKTYKSHECQVKEIQCEVEGCFKMFTKQSGYNQHIVKIHGHTKMSKNFCAICKQVINASVEQFKRHRKQCNKEFMAKEQLIECEVCKKQCKSLKSYTVHKMFHDSRNISKSGDESGSPKKNSSGKGPVICELCGNKFTNSQGLRTHKKNVHLIGSSGEVYQCDICSKIRPTKRSLFNHMRNVHRVQETPCTVCTKVFRTKALLQKHMMYHDETKRIHYCQMCPDKPGYFTAVALRRHQKSHHIGQNV